MPEQIITCPQCGKKIELTEAFTHDIEEKLRHSFEQSQLQREAEFKRQLEASRHEHESALAGLRKDAEAKAKKAAEDELGASMADLKSQVEENRKKLQDARAKELDYLKKQRELEEREGNFKLEMERALAEQTKVIREEATRKVDEEYKLKDREKDRLLDDMRKQMEDMRRKVEQGSQQSQGEILELEFESLLRSTFPFDQINPVGKGIKGADVTQLVMNASGQVCGTIIWEMKRTKAWSDGWIAKLKDDQRAGKADIAVIVSTVLPKDVQHLALIDGVWVSDMSTAMGLATALRVNLTELMHSRNSLAGKGEKMELLYNYLLGNEFKLRVEAIVEAFVSMKDDLESERRAMEKNWAKREKQIQKVMQSTAGMHGDLQGIIGASLPQIQQLELGE